MTDFWAMAGQIGGKFYGEFENMYEPYLQWKNRKNRNKFFFRYFIFQIEVKLTFSGGGCERGNALLYPSTQEAVQCDPLARGCPQGYLCLPHVFTKKYQCCSVSASRDNNTDEAEITCPSYMVKLIAKVDGKSQVKCGGLLIFYGKFHRILIFRSWYSEI